MQYTAHNRYTANVLVPHITAHPPEVLLSHNTGHNVFAFNVMADQLTLEQNVISLGPWCKTSIKQHETQDYTPNNNILSTFNIFQFDIILYSDI